MAETNIPVETNIPIEKNVSTDSSIPNPQILDTAQKSLQLVTDQVQTQVQQISDTTKQIVADPTKVIGLVGDQLGNLSSAVGAEELLQETVGWVNPMKNFVVHTLKMAFFLDPQQRASRGEFIVGGLASFIVVSIVSAILPIILGGLGLFLSMVLSMLPVLHLGVKRFHDMNKSGRWAVMVIIPLFGWIMPSLFKSVNNKPTEEEKALSGEGFKWIIYTNDYGTDPAQTAPQNMEGYIIIILLLFTISSFIITVLGFIGINVSAPSVDSITDTESAINQTQQIKNETVNQTKGLKNNTIDATKKTVDTTKKTTQKITQ